MGGIVTLPPGVWGGMGMGGLPCTAIVDDGYTTPAWAMGLMGCNKNICLRRHALEPATVLKTWRKCV